MNESSPGVGGALVTIITELLPDLTPFYDVNFETRAALSERPVIAIGIP